MSNVLAAQAQLNFVNSDRFPQINLQGGANRTQNSNETKVPHEPKFAHNLGLASVLHYELDLWGTAANASESAKKTFLASEYSKAASGTFISYK
ncbi:hypothetical protein [Candidatus Rickettsia kedanie]|uniref:Uncharacterized protein n=1 Tax=Candidatus Rickettsia kedanie TaxID=3115352 RepID=A0ABP9TWL3_9RICK